MSSISLGISLFVIHIVAYLLFLLSYIFLRGVMSPDKVRYLSNGLLFLYTCLGLVYLHFQTQDQFLLSIEIVYGGVAISLLIYPFLRMRFSSTDTNVLSVGFIYLSVFSSLLYMNLQTEGQLASLIMLLGKIAVFILSLNQFLKLSNKNIF